MNRYHTIGITIALLSLTSPVFAGSTTLTTYYPAPSGNYDNLTVNGILTSSGSTTVDNISITSGTASSLKVNGNLGINKSQGSNNYVYISPDNGRGIKFFDGSDLMYVGSGNNGVAIPSSKSLILDGGSLIIGTPGSVNISSRSSYPINLTSSSLTSAISKKIALDTNSGFTGFGVSQSGLAFYSLTSGSPQLFINREGNLGIKTTNPAYALDVAGDVNIDGNIASVANANITFIQAQTIAASSKISVNVNGTEKASMNSDGTITGNFKLPISNACPGTCEDGMIWIQE